jgi:RES domain-containing protein
MKLYRITNKKYANLDGIGGIYVAGRWNMKGHRVIYAAESISLAAWEKFVHITDYRDLPTNLVVITINIPDDIEIEEVSGNVLVSGWNLTLPFRAYKSETVLFGTEFLTRNTHLVLKVPSAVISEEYNYLLNPNHPDINKCTIEKIEPFKFDKRITK